MSDFRDLLDEERRRFVMPDGSLEGLERRRNRKRRNGRILAGILALVIAAAGVGGGLFALRSSTGPRPTDRTPTPTPTPVPAGELAVSPPSGPIQFVDAQHGWAVIDGAIKATTDGGQSWSPQDTGSTVSEVAFVDAEHGWAISTHGLVRTVDGGAHWVSIGESGVSFSEIQFQDDHNGWGIRLDAGQESRPAGVVVRTTDGGNSWVSATVAADSVCSASDGKTKNVWAARPGGIALIRSTDDGASWVHIPIEGPLDSEGWSASLQCLGNEVWVQFKDGGAAGHVAYGVFQSVDGAPAQLVLQEAGTTPFGHKDGVYESEDPYPGPFNVVAPEAAYLMNWCPACGGGPQASVSITITGGEPPAVTDRFPVVAGDRQGQPLGVSFLAPERGEKVHGWALLNVGGPKGSNPTILETTDGGRTWTVCYGPGT